MFAEEKDKKLLIEAGLFFPSSNKGSFLLPPRGYALWQNIQNVLDKKLAKRGVQNVLLPTLIPLNLLAREKNHIAGFHPECFYVEKIGEKKLTTPLVLRPTSEVLFAEWYRQILQSYQQLPFLYNQWCSVFRAEKNTSPFLRNTEFWWQEGHTLHSSSTEARQFTCDIWTDYQNYAENVLNLGIIAGRKSEGEKFVGAIETYTVECLLPDGQCLQLATSHYLGDNFSRPAGVKFRDKNNQTQFPWATSWGTSTRAIGAVVKTHADHWGVILPFEIAPVQIAFILIDESPELLNYYQEIADLLIPYYRCQLYQPSSQVNLNILQADKEGCPFKIILGSEEVKKNEITLVRRDNIERKIPINLTDSEIEQKHFAALEKFAAEIEQLNEKKTSESSLTAFKKGTKAGKIVRIITQEVAELQKNLYQKSVDFRDKHIFPVNNFPALESKIKKGVKGLFLIPFCNQLGCETKIKEKVPAYSIRCLVEPKETTSPHNCLFCQSTTVISAYLGRSY